MSEPTPAYGAPSLGPIDRVSPNAPKENKPMGDHSINGGYGHQPLPAPPAPQPQPTSEQK